MVFFTVFFVVYWAVRKRLALQNCLLLLASYIFYGWWDWRFLSLIAVTTVSTYVTARLCVVSRPKLWTVLNIMVNVGILVAFKYFDFFSDTFVSLLSMCGWHVDGLTLNVLLPIGISFYTLQAVSYSIDVYRRTVQPCDNLITFASFIAFFPQLVAGPIERARELLPQISKPRKWDYDLACSGAREMLWGLFKKIAIADVCATYVDKIYDDPQSNALLLSIASILFFIQIYCDFSGYCNIARGVAAMLGVRLTVNFRYPLFARNVADFWRRWHISLMSWFRDYIYIPLGGSKHGRVMTYTNIMIVFVLSGLWHGASWNYVLWGTLCGVAMVCGRMVSLKSYDRQDIPAPTPMQYAKMRATGVLIALLFVVFRLHDVSHAVDVIVRSAPVTLAFAVVAWLVLVVNRHMGRYTYVAVPVAVVMLFAALWTVGGLELISKWCVNGIFVASIIAVVVTEWRNRQYSFALEVLPQKHPLSQLMVYWLIIVVIFISNIGDTPFIYYQF